MKLCGPALPKRGSGIRNQPSLQKIARPGASQDRERNQEGAARKLHAFVPKDTQFAGGSLALHRRGQELSDNTTYAAAIR